MRRQPAEELDPTTSPPSSTGLGPGPGPGTVRVTRPLAGMRRGARRPKVVLSLGLGADSAAILIRFLTDPSSRDFALEDLVVVTEDGCRALTLAPKDPVLR